MHMHMYMHNLICRRALGAPMAGKNVALRSEVIELLDQAKGPGESYSDVVLRLAGPPRSLAWLADEITRLGPVDDDDLDRTLKAIRRDGRRRKPRGARL